MFLPQSHAVSSPGSPWWVVVPRTADSRKELSYALLLRRVHPDKPAALCFDGKLLKCGSRISYADLRPDETWPRVPLLLEMAGSDRTGSGHNRSGFLYVLWRYDVKPPAGWRELTRAVSRSTDWVEHMRPIVLAELGGPVAPDLIAVERACTRLLKDVDGTASGFGSEERGILFSMLHQQMAARLASLG